MCEGATIQDMRRLIRETLEDRGWYGVAIDGNPTWAYTIGLVEECDHPELILVGSKLHRADAVIGELAERVVGGERFDLGRPTVDVGGYAVTFGDVHPRQWERSTFAMWVDLYGAEGPPFPEPMALQVIMPPEAYCSDHRNSQPSLADPTVDITRSPNRFERRASERNRRRRRRR